MSYNVTQDNTNPALGEQRLFSGQGRLKASFSNNCLSPCQQKQCQPLCQLGRDPVLAVDDSRALKHNVRGRRWGRGVPVYRWPCQVFHRFASKQLVIHDAPFLPLLSCCRSLGGAPSGRVALHAQKLPSCFNVPYLLTSSA